MAVALGCVALAVAGCGVPGSGEPESLADAPGVGGPAAPVGDLKLPAPSRQSSPAELVNNFLRVGAAADFTNPGLRKEQRIPAAVEYAKQFLTPAGKEAWEPGDVITVIQVGEPIQTVDKFTVPYRRVGELDGDGTLTPLVGAPQNEELEFKVAPEGDSGPRLLASAPGKLLPLSLEGLQEYFEVRPVYFWDLRGRFLVPDRRYLSKGITAEKRVNTIVARVLAGPSEFLEKAVVDPPVEASIGNATLNGNNVVVNLPVSEQTDREDPLTMLASQLRWSLHPQRYSVDLKVGGRKVRTYSGTGYESANPSQPQTRGGRNEERLYAAVNGTVKPLEPGVTPPSILSRPENANVVAAAVNVRQNSAALVRRTSATAPPQLWVGRTPADQSAAQFRLAQFGGSISTFSRPSYLPGAGDRVLIVADNRLYDVDLGSGLASPVELPAVIGAPVAVSVAPDGARVAIVTATRAYVATLDPSKVPALINSGTGGSVREIFLGGLTNLKGVGWYYEHQLAVGGENGLVIAAIDGGALEAVGPVNLQGFRLTQLSAVPWSPATGDGGNLVIEAAGTNNAIQAYQPYRLNLDPLQPPPSPAGASPAPSASGASAPLAPKVTAPFYADVI
ncbi:hypothetical protein GCM10009557_60330 [Virgisporangium ochraceum]|uniref:GerMN domain-containing protein n=1 Tax=Virgisporangium ochraceum TaxID=65505 RepID=A0A8J3ZSH4_9ACTN|nr:LpqB family beta-propeller domain-containing protein [Virgisporangium ochraceum]GIJ69392.1 hypothetical protein Voc01_043090 [Virgisporangium ochraceum]